MSAAHNAFSARIAIIGINPYVLVPDPILTEIFREAKKDKGKIPVIMSIDGHQFGQTLIKYSGKWRLYLNTPMRKAAKKELGDTADFTVVYDPEIRSIAMHPQLETALSQNKEAKQVYDRLPPSRQLEIVRYISFLKTQQSIDRNVAKAIGFLLGKERFIGRDTP